MVTLPFTRSKTAAPADDGAAAADPTTLTARLRRMGQGIALPIAAMPAAGLLLRLGQDDLLGRYPALHTTAAVISGAGSAVLDYLPALFAVGIALGLNRAKDAAGPVLACLISYLILAKVVLVLNPLPADHLDAPPGRWPYGALAGIVGALLAMAIWKRVTTGRRRIPRSPRTGSSPSPPSLLAPCSGSPTPPSSGCSPLPRPPCRTTRSSAEASSGSSIVSLAPSDSTSPSTPLSGT